MVEPEWHEIVRDQLANRGQEFASRKRKNAGRGLFVSRVGFSGLLRPYLVKAAERRGITVAGYIRRAVSGFIAMDLDMEVTDLFEIDAAIKPWGEPTDRDLEQKRWGRWEVKPRGSDR